MIVRKLAKIVLIVIILFLCLATGIKFSFSTKEEKRISNEVSKKELKTNSVINNKIFSEIVGELTIEKIGLENIKIYEGIDDRTLAIGIGHFSSSSLWNGNVAIASHNKR